MWFVFALLSAVFAALTSILAKVGITGVNSNLAYSKIADRMYFDWYGNIIDGFVKRHKKTIHKRRGL